MKPITGTGAVLDSEFSVETYDGQPTLVLESRFGQVRNPDYNPAFELLLRRLGGLKASIADAIVDSTVSREVEFEQRRLSIRGRRYPIRIEDEDPADLRIAICAAQETVAQRPGARGGNRHKRIRLFLTCVEEAGLETLLVGGGSGPDPEVEAAKKEIERLSTGSGGQGRGLNPAQRRAVELRAVAVVTRRFRNDDWGVEDVSAQKRGYDLHVERDGVELHVEVKGTTGGGASVLLTPNEVRHCRANPPHAVLAVVAGIELSRKGGSWAANGGRLRSFDRWRLDEGVLEPVTYEWVLPPE